MPTYGRPKIHRITSNKTGKEYEVAKLRTEKSFRLPVYHYRRVGDDEWGAMDVDTLAEAREQLNSKPKAQRKR